MEFWGFPRSDGKIGTRNHLAVLSTVVCANEACLAIAGEVKPSALLIHPHGCCQTPPDTRRVTETLINLGRNPNTGAVLVVSLGCESVSAKEVAEAIAGSGKPVELVEIQALGGSRNAIAKGIEAGRMMLAGLERQKRVRTGIENLLVGLKCGSSDAFSGLITNPTVGRAIDRLIDLNAGAVFGEITEMLGAEHIVGKRACCQQVRDRLLSATSYIENEAIKMGMDMREGQPTPGNIKGGLTTIEEKSLGAIAKSGSREIAGFIEYGQQAPGTGLYVLDSPGREPEILTGLAAAGAQAIIFTTGMGAPQGHPLVPVIKVTANPRTHEYLQNHVDLFFTFEQGQDGFATGAAALLDLLGKVCSGALTKAEEHDYAKFIGIYTKGPVL
jgi:altronate dehydratase large subunit